MFELEKTVDAKTWLDKLANGINPLNNEAIPDGDAVNDVHISRCLFYVSDILRQVIDNGGITSKSSKSKKKLPFSITAEQLAKFDYSDRPISITEIRNRINSMIDTTVMNQLQYKLLAKGLIHIGVLCEEEDSKGVLVKRPTKRGNELGITLEFRHGMHGEYSVVVYNRAAQEFVIDNLEAILAVEPDKE